MRFDENFLRYPKYCHAKSSKQQVFTKIEHWVNFLLKKDLVLMLILLFLLQSILFAFIAAAIRLI